MTVDVYIKSYFYISNPLFEFIFSSNSFNLFHISIERFKINPMNWFNLTLLLSAVYSFAEGDQ